MGLWLLRVTVIQSKGLRTRCYQPAQTVRRVFTSLLPPAMQLDTDSELGLLEPPAGLLARPQTRSVPLTPTNTAKRFSCVLGMLSSLEVR